ncbi:PREDICTED: uncharacterized protein LOC107343050 isoform X4 [Acropora digitifera]|uniref:uncharacterized protein LOC107343050 isoform X4 n=1 Tax=Acropora digitifera TaxID=70779 RepID=UPI00077AB43F|nr:PREDICTED: uncharacterized protein LOC107343050 isoform X4 [Acropora digitifera]XP_015764063.1 PREDICTED: uncharacterized protein LOC107343050 isoform X4 [Acropora digitifera]XP_015764064.1 PREDICTED: uncharacterized protein LOC107343050 isoform X4 [Acropora digitifera]XP_015764065.1 PREDICTED: uncharacterized protein LOC107343050 isoform X4 [Acropora digitifera]
MSKQGSSFPGASGLFSQEATGGFASASLISSRKLKVTLLSSEWGSTKGGLSTLNRELAIQLAKNDNVEVSMYLPLCSEEDERAAAEFRVHLLKAKKKPGYDPIDWLASVPKDHHLDVVIGHGIRLGRQVLTIKELCPGCKWIQVVHTDPEELAMFKDYADPTVKGAKKHQAEVELCELADHVVAVGPKLTEAFACYLRSCGKDQDVINLTPGIFSEFTNINQAAEERETFRVLVFGRGDSDDFLVKGYDIAAHAVAMLKDEECSFKLVFVGAPDGEGDKVKERFLEEGILPSQLVVRSAKERDELAKQFYEADLVMMPSRTEAFGLAALEALSAGLPVLVSHNSGIGKALKKVPTGSYCVVNSEKPKKWAKAIRTICSKERKVRLREAIFLRQGYAETYQWEGQCNTLVEKMLEMIKETSTAPDQSVAAVNLGEQGPSSVSESVPYPDATTIQHIVGDAVSSGRENVIQGERPRTHPFTTTEGRGGLNASISEILRERQSSEKQGKRPSRVHLSASPTDKKQRRDADTFRVFNDNSVVVKLLRAEYNRRAQFNPLLWNDAVKLPLENVYTRLKIVSRWRPGSDTDDVNPCDIFGVLKKGDDPMILIEGSPGIGKTTFCLKLAYDWANQSSSAASFPEFELVLLLKCRDIDGELTEAITEQLFPKDMSKHAGEELLRFMEDIPNQEKVLVILDGLDELPEKSRHHVDLFLRRRILSFCYVLTTTRQEKGIEARKQFAFDILLKIEGFTEGDSFEYIRRHFKNVGPGQSSKGEKLIEEIKDNKLLRDLQKNPLHLLLLCVVYQDHEGKLPSSRTNLYQVIVVSLLRRYCARHIVKASKKDMDLEKQFKRDIRCLGELAWNCLLNDRHSFFEEELEELERRNDKLVVRELGFVYKEESLKVLKPQHEYCFLHKSFQEYLAASYVAHKLRRKKFNVFEHLDFDAVVKKFPQVFVFVCGILREAASILFEQIGEKLKSDWDWLKCSQGAANFFIQSWSESGDAEGMANTLCSFMPFPRFADLPGPKVDENEDWEEIHDWTLPRVLSFCGQFSKLEAPDKIRLGAVFFPPPLVRSSVVRDLASLPKLKFLDFYDCFLNVESAHELFQRLPEFASLTELALPDVPEMTDWGIVTKALTTSTTLETVGCVLLGERGEDWARVLDAGLCADTPLSSVNLRICGPMSETGLQALGNLFLNKSLSNVFVIVKGDMSHSLAVTLSRALAGQTVVKSLELRVNGKLSFCCANLIEQGIIKNNTISNFLLCLHGELPDNWPTIVENLNAQLAEKSTVTFEIYPSNLNLVSATQLTDVRPCVINYGLFEQESVTLNVWGELTVDGAEALYNVLPCTCVCHLKLNIHGKLTDDFLHCTARHVDKQKPLCPITINTWGQLTDDGQALLEELELDKNPAVTLNVREMHVPSDESCDNKTVSIDNPASLIALFEEAKNTGKENLRVTINVQSGDSTCDDNGDSTGLSWNDSLLLGLPRNCSLNSLTLTINNFSPRSSELSFTLISFLESCTSLKTLNLTLNEYNRKWANTYASRLREGLGRNSSLSSLILTLNIFARQGSPPMKSFGFGCHSISDDDVVPNISINSFTLTINNFTSGVNLGLSSGALWSNYKSLHTLNVTLNNSDERSVYSLLALFYAAMKVNSLRTLRLKINVCTFRSALYQKYDFSRLVVESPSLEFIELTICHYGDVGSWLETVKWKKQ